jgi:predicted dehydrogenase
MEVPILVEKPIVLRNEPHPWNFETHKVRVGYMLRFHPCVNFAKERIANELIGKPLWASFTVAQFNDKPAYLADGVVLNWSHEIDLALYLFGPAKVACASIAYRDGQDVIADFVLKHENGVRSTIHMDYVTKQEIREAWIVGTEKNIGLDLVGRTASWGRMVQQFDGTWDSDYLNEMAAWLSALEGKETMLATGQDGIEVVRICEAIKKAAAVSDFGDLYETAETCR